jgi:fatty-acyl-CoA synthase
VILPKSSLAPTTLGVEHILDRKKDMIVSGELNVFPAQIEDVLTGHPAIAQAAVIGVPDPKWGEAVTAFCVLRPDAAVTEQELIDRVKAAKDARRRSGVLGG